MKRVLAIVFVGLFATSASAQSALDDPAALRIEQADMVDLSEFRWKNRPIVVFADSDADPAFIEQMALLRARPTTMAERDVVVLTDTNPDAKHPLRLKMRPRGFMLVLVGKDGGIKLRKPFPWSAREISRSIDKMPIRQREIRDAKSAGGT